MRFYKRNSNSHPCVYLSLMKEPAVRTVNMLQHCEWILHKSSPYLHCAVALDLTVVSICSLELIQSGLSGPHQRIHSKVKRPPIPKAAPAITERSERLTATNIQRVLWQIMQESRGVTQILRHSYRGWEQPQGPVGAAVRLAGKGASMTGDERQHRRVC